MKLIVTADAVLILAVLFFAFTSETPAEVSGLEVTDSSYSTAALEWKKTDNAKSYRVFRSDDGKTYKYLCTTTENKYTDTDLRTGKTYYYTITSNNVFKSTDMHAANAAEVTPRLKKPKLKVDTSKGEMKLTYKEVPGAVGYLIIRNGEVISKTAENIYVDKDAENGGKYEYEVRAFRYKKEPVFSKYSNKVKAELEVLGSFTVEPMGKDLVLRWDGNDHYDSYQIYDGRELLAETEDNSIMITDFEYDKIYDIGVTGTTSDDSEVSPKTGRRFKVLEEPMDNKGAIDAAVKWGIDIANDDSFTYGTGKRAHRFGCYFCQTNVGPRLNLKGKSLVNGHSYEKTYCCNPFVSACFAHGAQDPTMLKACQTGHGIAMTVKSYTRYGCWKYAGKVFKSNLVKGDVLVRSGHVMLYIGDGQIVHAAGGGWGPDSIKVASVSSARYSFVMRYTGTGDGTMDVVRDVDDDGNALDENGEIIEEKESEDKSESKKEKKNSEKKDSEKKS